jgi:hypothetical protein
MEAPLPITYKDFIKNPIVGILFLSLSAISFLYVDNKGSYKDIINKQEIRITTLENKLDILQNEVHKRDSLILVIGNRINNMR